ncbi:MAG: PD40 domain-containing protein [Acidobacteria bacterium]|nr:PD40 domain-containing protein [Acidobacteriota bacterium]
MVRRCAGRHVEPIRQGRPASVLLPVAACAWVLLLSACTVPGTRAGSSHPEGSRHVRTSLESATRAPESLGDRPRRSPKTRVVIPRVGARPTSSRPTPSPTGTPTGEEGDSWSPSVSADGRLIVFQSAECCLVAGDSNRETDVFARDRATDTTTLVSNSSSGSQGNKASGQPAVSATGRFVAFASSASNLVSGDTNRVTDIFIRDVQADRTSRVSVSSSGRQDDSYSGLPAISADGRYVAFVSRASNLVPDDTETCNVGGQAANCWDIFVHDRETAETTRVSVSSKGKAGGCSSDLPSISADGRFVAFQSECGLAPEDTNRAWDVFVHDRDTAKTTRVSVASDGTQGNGISGEPTISADGRFVAFASLASNLVPDDTNRCADPDGGPDRSCNDVFVHDRETGETSRVSVSSSGRQADDRSLMPSISSDGRLVAFESGAGNLAEGDRNDYCDGEDPKPATCWDIFVHDRKTGETTRVSVSSSGQEANFSSQDASISAGGRYVAFESQATNLADGDDAQHIRDVFVHDRQTGETTLVS